MSKETPCIAFEPKAVQRALGELAANGPSYVRLGALRAMASMLRDTHDPHAQADPLRDQRMDAALDEVEAMIIEARRAAEQQQPADPDAHTDPEATEEQEAANEEDEPP